LEKVEPVTVTRREEKKQLTVFVDKCGYVVQCTRLSKHLLKAYPGPKVAYTCKRCRSIL